MHPVCEFSAHGHHAADLSFSGSCKDSYHWLVFKPGILQESRPVFVKGRGVVDGVNQRIPLVYLVDSFPVEILLLERKDYEKLVDISLELLHTAFA